MKIYTRTGDTGETSLLGGSRVSKDHARVSTYGTIDELNACLGLAITEAKNREITLELAVFLQKIQGELFVLGAELATPADKPLLIEPLMQSHLQALENAIDQWEVRLPPLTQFILPGGTELAGRLHVARTLCRRAERELVALSHLEPSLRIELIAYVNRLSDTLFVMARIANALLKTDDIPWVSVRRSVSSQ